MIQVFLDLDGVLVDLLGGLLRYHKIKNPYDNPENHGRYDVRHLVGMSPQEFWGVLDQDFWLDLEWMPDGRAILAEILKYVKPEQVTILSKPTGFPHCTEGKELWIKKDMPGFNYLIGMRKEPIAGPGKLLVDDHDDNVDKWVKAGGVAVQVPLLSNRWHKLPTLPHVKEQLEYYFANNHH